MSTRTYQGLLPFIAECDTQGGLRTGDVIAVAMPFLEDLHRLHLEGRVARLRNTEAIGVQEGRLFLLPEATAAPISRAHLLFPKPENEGPVVVTRETVELMDGDTYKGQRNALVHDGSAPLTKPRYIVGYSTWELELGHHDPLTDIHQCGLVLASLAFGLDLHRMEDLERFVDARDNLFVLDDSVHPALVSVIEECTRLYREDRPRSLDEVIVRLKNYRDIDPDRYADLTDTAGFRQQDINTRDHWILAKLRSRLFDLSRRNRLLHFRDTEAFVNLTVASVPPLLDHKNIDPNALLTWNSAVSDKLIGKRKLALNNYIDLAERAYIAPKLDGVRNEARKSFNEYGMHTLRLVIAFLHWTNFKDHASEKLRSPLLLLPVELQRKKGVKDQYVLDCDTNEAEVNPVLQHHLRELFGIELPDSIDLQETSVEALVERIRQQVEASASGIQLHVVDKPRIELVHAAARQAYTRTLQRRHRRAGKLDPRDYSYSYANTGFTPLGLQIYQRRVRPAASTFEYVINEDIRPGMDHAKGGRTFYSNVEESDHNPYHWEVDLCNVTLGNFNFRNMSLVRDYDHIIADGAEDEVFKLLFSDQPRALVAEADERRGPGARYPIIQADPTQLRAMDQAAKGLSCIIQGPPGTGKSQTITNLIADHIGQGKKVLFVCEKRAALDVVFHRLKQRGLDALCCRVHDSQADKKGFIMDLKATYEAFLKDAPDLAAIARRRAATIGRMDEELRKLAHFHTRMEQADAAVGIPLHTLFDRLIEARDPSLHQLDALALERTPGYSEWLSAERLVRELCTALQEQGRPAVIAAHPLAGVSPELLGNEHPLRAIDAQLSKCIALWDTLSERLDGVDLPPTQADTVDQLVELVAGARTLDPMAKAGSLGIFHAGSADAERYDALVKQVDTAVADLAAQQRNNGHWKQKPAAVDARNAAAQWERVSKGFFRFLNGNYRRIMAMVRNGYDLAAHQVKPDTGKLLADLCAEFDAADALAAARDAYTRTTGLADHAIARELVRMLRDRQRDAKWNVLLAMDAPDVAALAGLASDMDRFTEAVRPLRVENSAWPLAAVDPWLNDARRSLDGFSGVLPYLRDIAQLPTAMRRFLLREAHGPDLMAYLCAYKSLRAVYQDDRLFDRTDGLSILHAVKQLEGLQDRYLEVNVEMIRAAVQEHFRKQVSISDSSVSGMGQADRDTKKLWTVGRRILENEFGKSMRYKSIRELSGKESGPVVMALKPVWLMSPQSVSDILPIDTQLFDVVVYDEASQITLEEGVPALFRTGQTIIVGDEMQMPPTNFFSTGSGEADEEAAEDEERTGISLDADSLLAQGVRKLPGVMLGWHYRSRHESLISFSNAAFYQRGLLTIPDQQLAAVDRGPIEVSEAADAEQFVTALSDRPISFHRMRNGVYHERRNIAEAEYIARLIRRSMGRGQSIGVVAFSMEQQRTIEEALQRLGQEDREFEARLEEEYQRVEDDQFVGLFIKNLENVQGDERDIIIMSVCYGPNPNGRMLMNFGPINRRGGEKRLNVIFSRARKHMAVVSSIAAPDITNAYNEGANYLRRFLLYAERSSAGDPNGAGQVLDGLARHPEEQQEQEALAVTRQLRTKLEALGHAVDLQVGSSYFRCDLAVRATDGRGYRLGVLVDNPQHYRNSDVLEQYCQRPDLLRAFGWRVISVLAKDWFHQPEQVLDRVQRALAGEEPEEPILPALEEAEEVREEELPQEATTAPSTPSETADDYERYECTENGSRKFWSVRVAGTALEVHYGRIGTAGQVLTKPFNDAATAQRELEKAREKKLVRGYVRV